MHKFKYQLTIFFISINFICAFSQQKEALLKTVCDKYSQNELEYATVYNLYKTHTSQTIIESQKGFYQKKSNKEIYYKLHMTEFFVNPNVIIQVNHETKSLMITSFKTDYANTFNLSDILGDFKVKEITDKNKNWEIILLAGKNSSTPYSRIKLYIRKNYTIERQIFYYEKQIDFSSDYTKSDYSAPRLEVVYTDLGKLKNFKNCNVNDFFTVKKNRIFPAQAYAEYRIMDNRKQTN